MVSYEKYLSIVHFILQMGYKRQKISLNRRTTYSLVTL